MLKTILTLSFIVLFVSSFRADTIITRDDCLLRAGIKIISEQSGSYEYSDKTKQTFGAGFQVLKGFGSHNWSFESGIYFSRRVREKPVEFPTAAYPYYYSFPAEVSYNSITVPVNLRYNTRVIYVSAGIFADYVASITVEEDFKNFQGGLRDTGPQRRFLIGYNGAAGIEKPVSPSFNIFVEARLVCRGKFGRA